LEIGNWKRKKFNQKCSYRPNCQRVRNRSRQKLKGKRSSCFRSHSSLFFSASKSVDGQ
jgi:hypothetical protein